MKTMKLKHVSLVKGPSSALQNVIFFFFFSFLPWSFAGYACSVMAAAIHIDHTQKVKSQKFAVRMVGWGIN